MQILDIHMDMMEEKRWIKVKAKANIELHDKTYEIGTECYEGDLRNHLDFIYYMNKPLIDLRICLMEMGFTSDEINEKIEMIRYRSDLICGNLKE
jgi:mRNA deadenylase 3'-5' endonuclease subunit Ccr4